jgi:O-antigen/teichoic acid export membrane protein
VAQVSRKKAAIINLIFHYVAIILVLVQGIVLTPLYLRYISPALYGAWFATGNLLSWVQLVDPGLSRIMQQRVAHTFGQNDAEQLPSVIGTGLFLGLSLSLLPLLVIPFSGTLTGTLSLSAAEAHQLSRAFALALVSTCLAMASYQPTASNLGLQRTTGAGLIYLTAGVCGIVATLWLLYHGFGLLALPWGFIIRAGILLLGNAILLWSWCAKNIRRRIHITREELRKYAGLSSLTFVERLGNTMLQQSDAYICARFLSVDATAMYSLTGRAYEPVRMASERFGPAFLPGLAHLAGEGNMVRVTEVSDRLLNLVAYIGSVGAASVIALNSMFVALWVGPQFFGGQRLTVAFGVSLVMYVVLSCWSELVFAVGGIGQIEVMKAVEGVVKVAMQIVMVRVWGLIGLPIGACAGMLLVSGWYLPRLAAKLFKQRPTTQFRLWGEHLLRALAMILLGVAGHMIVSRLFTYWTWTRFGAVGLALGLTYALIGLALHPSVRKEAWFLLNRRRRFRKTRGLCLHCGYNLQGNISGICPECGRPIPNSQFGPYTSS